jgi:fluoride exporter
MSAVAWIGIGILGAAGAYARLRMSAGIATRWPSRFPSGTFAVNISGSFALGLLTGAHVAGDTMLVIGTGLLGAFTTFSTWMVDAQRLRDDHDWVRMWLYLLGSMLLGLAMTALGWLIGEALR